VSDAKTLSIKIPAQILIFIIFALIMGITWSFLPVLKVKSDPYYVIELEKRITYAEQRIYSMENRMQLYESSTKLHKSSLPLHSTVFLDHIGMGTQTDAIKNIDQ